tara:strand:- start:2383 stop:2565 length:183 start_codon:yes stop_codon:yes gene_type:complete
MPDSDEESGPNLTGGGFKNNVLQKQIKKLNKKLNILNKKISKKRKIKSVFKSNKKNKYFI